ncbi:MAG: hypothetical protein IPP71_20445 [Bacteroidetes bacterium]|nr:hypothetical protein [Bacteroidota bacterium]
MNLKNLLIYALVLMLGVQISKASDNPRNETFRLPKGVTSADMIPGTLIFKLKPEFRGVARTNSIGSDRLNGALNSIGSTSIVKKFPLKNAPASERNAFGFKMVDLSLIYEVKYNAEMPVEKVMNALLKTGMVEYAEPKYLPKLLFTPNDPNTTNQYFLGKIQAYAAWDIQQGDTNSRSY